VWRAAVVLGGFDRWHIVTVKRKNGALYTTSFYACSGCSAMFLNPEQFNALGHAAPNVEMPRVVALPGRRAASGCGAANNRRGVVSRRGPNRHGRAYLRGCSR